jgi:uncharacterized protein YndB with AHSA1/START domain
MANVNNLPGATPERELVITRLINAPRGLVWEAWTNPEQVMQWWGPDGFTSTLHEMEVKPGGVWRFTMHGPGGMDFPNKIIFTAVDKPSLLACSHSSELENDPARFETTVTFEEIRGRTWLTMRAVFATKEERDRMVNEYGAEDGGKQAVSRLEAFLYGVSDEHAFVITREFNAPRQLVYDVWSDASHLAAWWGPKGYAIEVKKLEFTPGGIFHYHMQAANGHAMWGRFVYREITPAEKIVFINSFSDPDGNITRAPFGVQFPLEVLVTVLFEEAGNKTRVIIKSGPIRADEEEMKVFSDFFASMKIGYGGTFDQLADHLETVTANK